MLKKLLLLLLSSATLCTSLFLTSAYADRFAYVVNSYPEDETLSKINLTTGEVTNHIDTLGESPNQIVIQGNFAYVVNSLDHDIQIIDLETENTVGYIIIGEPRNPFHIAFVDTQYAYVTNLMYYNTISKVDVINREVVEEFGVGQGPEGLLVVGNKLYICCCGFEWPKYKRITGRDWVFDPTHRANDVKAYRYIPGKVYVFDIQDEVVLDSIEVGLNPQYLDLDPEGELNVVCTGDYWSVFGQIYRIDPTTDTVIDSISTGGNPGVISIGSDGVGYLAGGGWDPDSGKVFTFDSYADTIIRGSENPIHTDCGVIAVTALHPSQVLTSNFDGDNISRMNKNGVLFNQYPVGNGPISTAIYTTSPQIPLLDQRSMIILIMLLALAGSFLLERRG
ncbi:MAG: YncE family protein [candidate division Zixibacteria bacterium]|nr:YncE family protein [candidate division Zixibacteria bacterium]